MKRKNLRIWVISILALLLVFIFVGYKYFSKGQQVAAPVDTTNSTDKPQLGDKSLNQAVDEVEEIRVGVVDLDLLRNSHPKVKMLDQLEDQIRGYLQEQSVQQSELLTNQQQVESQYSNLNSQLNEQVKGIQDKYQQMIDAKVEELQQELSTFEETTWQQAMSDIQQKQNDLSAMGQEAIERYHEKQLEQLTEVEKELSAQYTPEILNLRLKLQMIQLSEEEQKKYTDRLEKIQVEQEEKLEEVRLQLEEDVTKYIEDKQVELNEEIKAYQDQLKQNVDATFEAKRVELDGVLQAYIRQKEAEMQEEINNKQKRLDEQTQNGLTRAQQQIQQEIQKNNQLFNSKIEEARKKQEGILQQIDEDIKVIIAKIAQEQKLDVVLTDIRVNVQAQDLTNQVLKKLKQ